MIEKERIAALKRGMDLKGYIESRGIILKKNGKGYVGLCPFHEDTNPSLSVNPARNLWQCFGCGAGGDVIRFVELFDKAAFPEAVQILADQAPGHKSAKARGNKNEEAGDAPEGLTVKEKKLLARVVAYYQHTLAQDQRGIDYLNHERGIADHQSLQDFGTGFANGTLRQPLLPGPQPGGVCRPHEAGQSPIPGNQLFLSWIRQGLQKQAL